MAGSKKALGILFGVKGGSNISKDSGKLIIGDLKHIVNQINNDPKLLPRIVLRVDTTQAVQSINRLHKSLENLKNQANNITLPGAGGGSGSSRKGGGGKSSSYSKHLSGLARYVKEYKELQKVAQRTKKISVDSSGDYSADGTNFEKQANYVHNLAISYRELQAAINLSKVDRKGAARALGISETELDTLTEKFDEFQTRIKLNSEKNARSSGDAWLTQSTKIAESVRRQYDVISKDPAIKDHADKILRYTEQASGSVDDLKAEYQQLKLEIRQSGADIETWGQKFKKAFGNHVRSALASLVTLDIGQVLRGVYDNVVQLDDAVVNLQIASGKSRVETKALVKEYAALAKQLKTTTAEVSESADTWLRQGYNAAQATTLITNSTMLSKLGQMEAADASTALTSAMKGYKIAVEDSVNIVDKLTAVDMEAAASAGGIATAMAETSASANLAGVSMDTLIGYIATVKEVTQDSDESVGTFFKTMFARMGNIKVGKFVDEDGESLNDVETVLGEVGIKLRSDSEHFRDFSEVLDEVGAKWDGYNEVQKHAIATAIAGTRQQEKFLTLMSNYGTALGYAETAANSAGTAVNKYGAYTEGVTGKLEELKATFEELSLTVLDSDFLSQAFDYGIQFVELTQDIFDILDRLGGLKSMLPVVISALAVFKAPQISKNVAHITTLIDDLKTFAKTFKDAYGHGLSARTALDAGFGEIGSKLNSTGLMLSGAVAAIGVAATVIGSINAGLENSASKSVANARELIDKSQSLESDYDELVAQYKELYESSGGVFDEKQAEKVQDIQDEIKDLVGEQADSLTLVNGELDKELLKLEQIRTKTKEISLASAQEALTDAEDAIKDKRKIIGKTFDFNGGDLTRALELYGGNVKYSWDWMGALFGSADELLTGNFEMSDLLNSGVPGLVYQYSQVRLNEPKNIQEFISQYEEISKLKSAIATGDDDELKDSNLYDELSDYISHYKDVYDTYISARDTVERLSKETENGGETIEVVNSGIVVSYKGVLKILEEVAPGYDALSEALSNATSEGYLTADALSSLLELETEGKIGGVETAKLITETAEGYKLATDALEQYVSALVNRAIAETKVNYADEASKKNAIKNLETLMSVLATLSAVQEGAPDPVDALNAEKDVLDDQLDRYKELIDLRKDLIETYADELEYQRELEKKQQKVASLQTKLTVARLDNSAAGQARVRELESQLKDAQEDLEDFTLEHAIDEILDGLDNQYSEYENFIKKELEKIEAKLDALKNPDSIKIAGLDTYLAQIRDAIVELNKPDELSLDKMFEQWQSAYNQAVWGTGGDPDSQKLYEKAWEDISNLWNLGNKSRAKSVLDQLLNGTYVPDYSETEEGEAETDIPVIKDEQIGLLGTEIGQKIADAVSAWLNRDSSDDTTEPPAVAEALDSRTITRNVHSKMNSVASEDRKLTGGRNAVGIQNYYMGTLDNILEMMSKSPARAMQMYEDLMKNKFSVYHEGGFVGGYAGLRGNEEFAKLMKTEFVSTPTQIQHFMNRTLPQIASGGGSAASQEFNAPLIEINCESVTSESMPMLKEIVDEAVAEVKRCLDGGMSRTGYKRTVKKLLT